jgi:hypothetical protein
MQCVLAGIGADIEDEVEVEFLEKSRQVDIASGEPQIRLVEYAQSATTQYVIDCTSNGH